MAISIIEFSDTKPVDGTINVLMSSSNLDGADMIDYVIRAISIPHQSDNSIDVEGALNILNEIIIFQSGSNQLFQSPNKVTFDGLTLTRKSGYSFIQFEGMIGENAKGLTMSSSTYSDGLPYFNNLITGSDNTSAKITYLEPFVEGRIDLSQYHATENNAVTPETSWHHFKVDRDKSQLQPNNLEQITASLENSTSRSLAADVQESNYTTTGWANARYDGSKLWAVGTHYSQVDNTTVSSSYFEDTPSMNFTSFEASKHNFFANDVVIKAIDPNERQLETFYFNFSDATAARIIHSSSLNTPVFRDSNQPLSSSLNFTSSYSAYSKYPTSGSHIYDWEEGIRRYIRVPSSKFYLLETGTVVATNEKGAYESGSS